MNEDTINLLNECNSGVQMGIDSINDVLPHVKDNELRDILVQGRNEHESIAEETENLLDSYGREGKDPSPVASGMSWIKTNFKLAVDSSDSTISDLITDGCDMGVKSMRKFINMYPAAEDKVKSTAEKLISCEENMQNQIKRFL